MNAKQQRALKRIAPVLQDELQVMASSYTNMIGPAVGRIIDSDVLSRARAIEAFMKAFEIEYAPLAVLCKEQIRRFESTRPGCREGAER